MTIWSALYALWNVVLIVWLAPYPVVSTRQQEAETERASIRQLLESGAYSDAERQARALCDRINSQADWPWLDVALSRDILVEALVANGKAAAPGTLALAEEAIRLKLEHLPDNHLELASSLHNSGVVHVERGEFSVAVVLHQRGLAIRSGALPPGDSGVADSLDRLAVPLIRLQRFAEARQILERARIIREALADRAPLALARTLELVALLERDFGNYGAAKPLIERALDIRRRFSPQQPEMISPLRIQGDVLWLSGDIAGAQRTWTDALAVGELMLRPRHPIIARLLRRLALAAEKIGDMTGGRTLRERALDIAEASLAPCDTDMPGLWADQAISLTYDGEYLKAQKLYQRAHDSYERCLGTSHSLTVTVVHNEAALAIRMGDLAEAERLLKRAIRDWSVGLGPNHPYIAWGLDELGDVAASRGQYVGARTLYQRALRIRRSVRKDHPDVAFTLTSLARTNVRSGNLALALREIDEAIGIYQRVGVAEEPARFAQVLDLRAEIEGLRGDYASAHSTLAEALATRERLFGRTHPLTAETRAKLSSADFALGSYDAALDAALEAEQQGRNHLRFTVRYLPERGAMAYAAKRPKGLDLALSLVAAGHVSEPSQVFDGLVLSRGIVLDELGARSRLAAGSDPELASLTTSLVSARQRFANLMLRSWQDPGSVPLARLDEARTRKEEAERTLAGRSVEVQAELTRARAGLPVVRESLPPRSALVSFVRYERSVVSRLNDKTSLRVQPSYMAFIVRSGATDVAVVPLGSAASLEAIVRAWRDEAARGANVFGVGPKEAEASYRTVGGRLRRRIWDPLTPHLAGVARVFVVPDGALNFVSLGALPTPAGTYLGESSLVLHYVSTERDLVSPTPESNAHGLLAVGGPAFGGRSTATQPSAPEQRSPARAPCDDLRSLHFDALPETTTEVNRVARIWSDNGAGEATVLTGRAASESAVKNVVVDRQVVHFATHGFFLDPGCAPTRSSGARSAESPLLLSGLAFAGANDRGSAHPNQDDGILTAEEVAGLNLQSAEWAVLSACDTGLGEIRTGEGVFGFRRAFQIAGAHTVIMSLWSVDDEATQSWMTALYRARFSKKLSTADAMRDAGVTVLRARRARGESTHPFYWAAFVAAGDWR